MPGVVCQTSSSVLALVVIPVVILSASEGVTVGNERLMWARNDYNQIMYRLDLRHPAIVGPFGIK